MFALGKRTPGHLSTSSVHHTPKGGCGGTRLVLSFDLDVEFLSCLCAFALDGHGCRWTDTGDAAASAYHDRKHRDQAPVGQPDRRSNSWHNGRKIVEGQFDGDRPKTPTPSPAEAATNGFDDLAVELGRLPVTACGTCENGRCERSHDHHLDCLAVMGWLANSLVGLPTKFRKTIADAVPTDPLLVANVSGRHVRYFAGQAPNRNIDVAQLRRVRVPLMVRYIEHRASAGLAKAPSHTRRRPIPGNVGFALDVSEPVGRHRCPGDKGHAS